MRIRFCYSQGSQSSIFICLGKVVDSSFIIYSILYLLFCIFYYKLSSVQYLIFIDLILSEYLQFFHILMKGQAEEKPQPKFEINREHTFQPCFETNSSFLSRALFVWSHKLIKRGNEKHLEMEDLSDLRENQQPKFSAGTFQSIFHSLSPNQPQKLLASFKKFLGGTFFLAGFLAAIANLLQFAGPITISRLLEFLSNQDQNKDVGEGLLWVSILILCYLLRTIIFQHSMHFVNLSCIKVLNSANSLIYNKILKLSSSSRKYLQVGSIMNNVNVDVYAFYYFIMMSTFLFSAPLMILVAIIMLIVEVGWIGLVAPLLFFIGMAVQQRLMTKGFEMRKDQLFWSDKRSKCVNQYFSGIRIIKYYGWEQMVAQKIEDIRTEQLSLNYKVLMIRTYVQVLMNMLPIFSSIIIFAVFVAVNGEDSLTTAKVYTVLSIFNLIAMPMRLIVITLINYMNGKASLQRVEHLLGYEEKNMEGINNDNKEMQVGEIQLKSCKFNWETETAKKHFQKGKELNNKNKKPEPKKQQKKDEKKPKKKSGNKKKKPVDQQGKKKKKKSKKKSVMTEGSLSESLLPGGVEPEMPLPKAQKSKYALEIQNLRIQKGQFVSIIGRVGSGKSTMLSAILGQIDKVEGSVNRRGKVAYIPQTSWLRSATIRENILFQSPYQEERYDKVLQICQLKSDLQILGGGDLTEIGEKGVNLSGGQKQRISIARAIYTNADIYLIDDCLSALDPYVAKKVFFNVIKQFLQTKGKTIVFVTNAIDYTQECDRVIVLDGGKIVQDAPPNKLIADTESLFSQIKLQYKQSLSKQEEERERLEKEAEMNKKKKSEDTIDIFDDEDKNKDETKDTTKTDKKDEGKKQIQGLVKVQERLKGSVPWKFYLRFFTGPGQGATFLMFFFILLAQCARVASDWWLGQWGRKGFDIPQSSYIWIYSIISLVVGALLYLKGVFFAKFILSTSRVIQRQLIKTLLKSPLSWFDVTPTGRILARTTKDQDDLDNSLSFNVQNAAQNLFVLLASVLLISIATPLYLIVAAISGVVYYKLVTWYMNSSREIKRLQSNTKAPLISHFQETVSGMYVIRAFQKQQIFTDKFFVRQKHCIVSIVNQNIASRWIGLMTDLFSVITIAAAGYLGIVWVVTGAGTSGSNLIGLALVWSLQINGIMSFTLRIMADTESNMNAVVRLYQYIDENPAEKDFEEPRPAQNPWPNHGIYDVKQISYKYRPELPLVIKRISFDIKENAKIGIVGRTGSGKSTMTLGLLRILQIAQNDDGSLGVINLDDQNISEIGLHHLRHNVAIIPQDPVLFTGTIKTNIDPLDKFKDEDIAQCLKKVELWDQIKDNDQETTELRRKIYSSVDQSGSNFSLGQRQLICMARALIRQPKVLLMDQATASIDQKTDQTIQTMIRKEFVNTTVITIAHRLNTIIQYDKILVLNNGEVEEYDTPVSLVKNPGSFLGKIIRKVGKGYLDKMVALAEKGMKQ